MADPSPTTSSSHDSISPLRRNKGSRIGTMIFGDEGNGEALEKVITIETPWILPMIRLRGKTDQLPQDWWFASTAIPLLAATIGPLANVLSIAALVSKWRVELPNDGQLPEGADEFGIDIPDTRWEIVLNAISLGFGFFGNFCLLLNFTKRVRYIVALPFTIISWYFATGILTGIIVAMHKYVPPIRPGETYSQGFWHAIIAAVLYLIGSMILMINMLGYFLGHYPQHFDLDDDQRTLILQTMMFFFWLAGGAAVFQQVCDWSYADALYFCDVTVLTIGFGDYVGTNDAGRGLVFPYAVIGIIFLGLMIKSIRKFASGMSKTNVVRKHQLAQRRQTFGRTVTSEKELRERLGLPPIKESPEARGARRASNSSRTLLEEMNDPPLLLRRRGSLDQYGHFNVKGRTVEFHEKRHHARGGGRGGSVRQKPVRTSTGAYNRDAKMKLRANTRRTKLVLLKEEKDRFDAMREIQSNTHKFEKYWALSMSVLAFGLLWCVGAVAFMYAEERIQGLSYFQSLYFCYVSLLTIGYGDFSPKSNAGKPFFIIWSLIAIPTMTILISDMSETVVGSINRGTFKLADWTIMPKEGVWHDFLENHPKLRDWLEKKTREREAKKRINAGFMVQRSDEEIIHRTPKTLENLAEEKQPAKSDHELARLLAQAIKRVANNLKSNPPVKYCYEEWVDFTRLIKFSAQGLEGDGNTSGEEDREDGELGLINWDWIGEDSPMLADVGESEWVLERLCESLDRYTKIQGRKTRRTRHVVQHHDGHHEDPPISCEPDDETFRTSLYHHYSYPPHPGRRPHQKQEHHNTSPTTPVLSHDANWDHVSPIHGNKHKGKEKEGNEKDSVEQGKDIIKEEKEGDCEEWKRGEDYKRRMDDGVEKVLVDREMKGQSGTKCEKERKS